MANQISQLISQAGIKLPGVGNIIFLAIGGFLFLVLTIGLIIFGWWAYNKLAYNRRIIIFEKVGQIFEPTGKDKAREFKIGEGGERVLYLKKRRIWKVAEKQASRNTYWFAILDDGYWYNTTLGDLNKELGEFKVTGISPEMHKLMRYQSAGLRKNLSERHLKKKWYEHPLVPWAGAMVFVLVTGIVFWLIAREHWQHIPQTLNIQNQMLERTNNLIELLQQMGCTK